MTEGKLDPRLFEAGAILGSKVDPDYLAAWAHAKLPALLAANPDASAAAIAEMALREIPEKFHITPESHGQSLYQQIREEAKARRDQRRGAPETAADRMKVGGGR
jgi:hypothetical protein